MARLGSKRINGVLGVFYLQFALFFILLVIYSFLRIGFYFYNKALFPQVDGPEFLSILWGGVKFDIAALLYINALYILLQSLPWPWKFSKWWQKIIKVVFVVFNAIGIALNLVDFLYYPFTLKRTTGTLFAQFANESNWGTLALNFFMDYWFMVLFFIVLVWCLVKIYDLFIILGESKGWRYYFIHTLATVFIAFLFIGGVRGGWAHSTRPITISNAGDYVSVPEHMSIVVNTPFSILRTLKATQLEKLSYFTEDELQKEYSVIHLPVDTADFDPKNVVVLILESFAKEHVGALNKDIQNGEYKGYTPFLDSLIDNAYTFKYTYANGRKSIDALPSIFSGIPSIGEPFVLSIYSSNRTTSLPQVLLNKGYSTAFYHGAPNGSMGFSAYAKLAGFEYYFGKDEYENDKDFDGIWGIWDEPFMQFMASSIDTLRQPFFAGFFSLSSHHPFKVPKKYQGKFPKGPLPVQEPIGYTDNALRRFFQRAKSSSWYDNTLFVICADHATVSHLPEYQNTQGAYAIPIVFYYPGGDKELVGMQQKVVQQIDILPTVLNFLNYPEPYFAFGFDAFRQEDNFSIVNNDGIFTMFYDSYVYTHDGNRGLSLFDLQSDPLSQNNIIGEDKSRDQLLERKLMLFRQQYNNRMLNNELLTN